MRQLTVRNVRGIESADIALDGLITVLCGVNGSGKSSVCLAAAAALTGNISPISLRARGADKGMARDNCAKGVVSLTDGESRSLVEWPSGKSQTLGQPPTATPAAAGLISLVTLPSKERAAAFAELFATEPTREDLDATLTEAGGEAASHKLWQYIQQMGWDAAAGQAADNAKTYKGQWRECTGGATWGSDAGATWVPADWTVSLDVVEQAELEGDVEQARAAVHNAVASAAVAGERRAELERIAAGEAEIEARIANLKATDKQALEDRHASTEAREKLQDDAADRGVQILTCPECGATPLAITREDGNGAFVLAKITPMLPEELERVRKEIASCDGKISNAQGRIEAARAGLATAEGELKAAREAKAALATLQSEADGAQTTGEGDPDAALRRAEANLVMWRAKRRADELHRQILRQVEIAAACGPQGARARKLDAALAEINGKLAELSAAMGTAPVAFNGDLDVFMGRRTYAALSASEQWRARVLVQLEIARRDGSSMAVLDGADILDNAGRAGLAGALQRAGVRALVAMTSNAPCPDMFKAAGLGRSYWLAGGKAIAMDDAHAAAQQKAA